MEKYVKILKCPKDEKHIWYSQHVGELFKVIDAPENERLYQIVNPELIQNKRTKRIFKKHGHLFVEKNLCYEDTFLTQFRLALETKIRKQKRRKKLNFSVPLDEKTIVELEELIAREYKTITKTEWCRYAVEYCMKNTKFIRELKAVD